MRFRTKRTMKDKKVIDAVCNVSVLVILLGILVCVLADTSAGISVGFAVIEIGAVMCIVCGYIHERMYPVRIEDRKRQEKEDIQKANDIYQPTYRFMDYLVDNSCSLEELNEMMEGTGDKNLFIEAVYLNYKVSAKGAKVQSRNDVKRMIQRAKERREAG